MMYENPPLLSVQDLSVKFGQQHSHTNTVVQRLSFDIHEGEKLALVGESGSGKTSLVLAILKLIASSGKIEFDKTDLSPEYKDNFHAPYVTESPLQIGMKFLEEYYIKANGTILVLGEVTDLYFKDSMLSEDGFLNLSKVDLSTPFGMNSFQDSSSINVMKLSMVNS